MSHELETIAGKTSFVSAREHAWHRLGQVLDSTFTAETALEQANLAGWNVRKVPLTLPDGGVVPEKYGMVRTNPETKALDSLGVVGEKYQPIQNEEHCELLNALVDESGAHFETAGSLRGGKQVFVTMKLPDHMMIGGIDQVDTYISALNSHDGNSAFKLIAAPVRIVCANTQAAALRAATGMFNIHHTRNHSLALDEARNALGLTFKYIEGFQAEAEKMIEQAMTEAQFQGIIDAMMGEVDEDSTKAVATKQRRVHADLMSLFLESPTATEIRGTAWAGYQAFTEYADFYSPVKSKADADQARAFRSVAGTGLEFKSRAFELLTV